MKFDLKGLVLTEIEDIEIKTEVINKIKGKVPHFMTKSEKHTVNPGITDIKGKTGKFLNLFLEPGDIIEFATISQGSGYGNSSPFLIVNGKLPVLKRALKPDEETHPHNYRTYENLLVKSWRDRIKAEFGETRESGYRSSGYCIHPNNPTLSQLLRVLDVY